LAQVKRSAPKLASGVDSVTELAACYGEGPETTRLLAAADMMFRF